MAYVSLYRKYRPQTFTEVVGQAHITTTLGQAVVEDRVHHAYLFTGPRGTGKTSTARILAKSLNCEHGPTAEPCNACTHCVAITAGSSVDVIEIDAASHGGVDDIRDLRDRVAFAPASARTKVYIVDECHMLSTAGWNAFLKTVEEPPGHVVFVFATTEPHKVLDTILSRTQRFDFKRVGAADLAAHVRSVGAAEGVQFEAGAVELVVRAGDGSVRDTLSVLDQVLAFTGDQVTAEGVADVLGAVPEELLDEAADFIAAGDVAGLCVLVGRLADAGHDLRQFAREAVEHLRALFLLQSAPDAGLVEGTPERLVRMTDQAGRLGQAELLRAVELLADAQAQMRLGSVRLPLEIALAKAAMPEASGDPAALAARIDRLERSTEGTPTASQAPEDAKAPQPTEAVQDEAPSTPAEGRGGRADERPGAGAEGAETEERETQPIDLDLVTARWPAVLEATKGRKRTLHAFLTEGRAVALDGNRLTLQFRPKYAFHAEQCAEEQAQAHLRDVFAQVVGVPLQVRCVLADSEGEPSAAGHDDSRERAEAEDVAEAEAAEAAGELPDEQEAHEAAIKTLSRDLGATVVEE